jgi:hypothetical protein
MTNTILLKQAISSSGLRIGFIAGKLGITRQTLSKKVNGISEFYGTEIQTLSELLDLSLSDRDRIFFAQSVGN